MADVETLRRHADAFFARSGGLSPPSDVILSWPRPNHINPETHGWTGSNVVIAFLIVAILVYTARMWARLVVAKNSGLDDLVMTIAILPLIGATVSVLLGNRVYGFQWHVWDQTPETLITVRQITLANEMTYLAATSLTKISILCFYRRITNVPITLTFVYWVWAGIAFVIAYFFTFTFAIIFSCTPIEGYWHIFDTAWRLQNELHCYSEGAEIVAAVMVGTLQDFFICTLPIFLVRNLKIPRRQKVALIGLFGVGIITCVSAIMRCYYAIHVFYFTYDITWYAYYGWIWTAVEADLAVMCASAPALKVFFHRYFNQITNRSSLSGPTSRKPPVYAKGSPWISQRTSNIKDTKWKPIGIPLKYINVSTSTGVVIKDRGDARSEGSTSSTRRLTGLQSTPSNNSSHLEWLRSGTICAAFRPGLRGLRKNSCDRDIEREAGND